MLDIVQLPLGAYRTNCYLVAREGASDAAVIDPGDSPDTVLSVLADHVDLMQGLFAGVLALRDTETKVAELS